MEAVKAWLLFIHIYAAPPNAIDYDGPWKYGATPRPRLHQSLEACREEGVSFTKAMFDGGVKAPTRWRCVKIDATLPEGVERLGEDKS